MPRELPGFYFDAEKNRYFPSSSRKDGKSRPPEPRSPATHPPTSDAASSSLSTPVLQTRRRSWHAFQRLRLATCPRQRIAAVQLRRCSLWQLTIPILTARTCQPDDDGSARGLNSISGYSYPCVHWPDRHSLCCALSTSEKFYMIVTYTSHRLEIMMVTYGPLLVTAMASYIHLILPLAEIFCQYQVMCCNIHGPEDTASNLQYVH